MRIVRLVELLRAQVFLVHTLELCGRGSPCVNAYFHETSDERYNENSWSATTETHYRHILAVQHAFLGFCGWGH